MTGNNSSPRPGMAHFLPRLLRLAAHRRGPIALVLMFMLLTLVLLDRLYPAASSRPGLLGPLFRGRAQAGTYLLLTGFSLFQLLPYTFPGDRAVTGEGRISELVRMLAPAGRRLGLAARSNRPGFMHPAVVIR